MIKQDFPLVFISHKHCDRAIATTLAAALREDTRHTVEIFCSSDPNYEGVRAGKRTLDELRAALWRAQVLILLYTTADADWSYCMWEAGVANDPVTERTQTIVFQCGNDTPKVFEGYVYVDVRKVDDLRRFLESLFRDENYFPNLGGRPLSRWPPERISDAATALHKALADVLHDQNDSLRPVLPHIRFRLDATAEGIQRPWDEITDLGLVSRSFKVSDASGDIGPIFGRSDSIQDKSLSSLFEDWFSTSDLKSETGWHDSFCHQIIAVMKGTVRKVPYEPIRSVDSGKELVPILSQCRRGGFPEVEFLFVDADPSRLTRIESKMLKLGDFHCKIISAERAAQLKLDDILAELNSKGVKRLPFLDESNHILYVIHESVITKFMVERRGTMNTLTLGDLLDSPVHGDVARSSRLTVPEGASLREARDMMGDSLSDVFITKTGSPEAPVLGWLTNVALRAAAAF